MKLNQYLDVNKLEEHLTNGYVKRNFHDQFPLVIYSYSRKAVQENLWDDVTRKCRGLIVNVDTGDVIARPFEKFFNLDTDFAPESLTENLPTENPYITEKLDGSLIISYVYNGNRYFASKSSFHSRHASWATKLYSRHILINNNNNKDMIWPENYTILFELVSPENRIVVSYGKEELVLIGMIDNETGEERPYHVLKLWAMANVFRFPRLETTDINQAAEDERLNEEGYVVTWFKESQPSLKVKIKFSEYLYLHRLVTGLTPKAIWKVMADNDPAQLDFIINHSTPELANFVIYWKEKLLSHYNCILRKCGYIYNEALFEGGKTRKEFASVFTSPENSKYSGVLFSMLDNNVEAVTSTIWKLVKEFVKYEQPLRGEYE